MNSQDATLFGTNNIEFLDLTDDVIIPSGDNLATDAPKKTKIIFNPNRIRLAAYRIKKKIPQSKKRYYLEKCK